MCCLPTIQVAPSHIALHLLPPEEQQEGQHTAAEPAWEDTAAGGKGQVRTAKRAAPKNAAQEKKQVRKTDFLGTGSTEPHYSARPRRAAAAAALQGFQVRATSIEEEEDASDGEPAAVKKAGQMSAGKEVGSAPGSRGAVPTSARREAFGGRVGVMDVDRGRSAPAATAGGGGEAKEAGAAQDHPYPPATARAVAAAPATSGSPVLQSKEPCASRVCSHLLSNNSTQRPTASACRVSLLPFSSTAAALGVEVVGSFNTMAAVAACLNAGEQHVRAPAEAATGSVRLPPESAAPTLGVEVRAFSYGPVLALTAPAAAAAIDDREEGGGRECGAGTTGMVPQGWLDMVVAPPIASSPKGGMLQGGAACFREGAANTTAVAVRLGDRDKGGVGSLQLAGAAPAISRGGEDINRPAPVTFGVKPEPSADALAEVVGSWVQLGSAAPPLAASARGSAATPVAGAAEASPPAAADAIADAALPVVSARATVAPATATADAAPPATSAAAIPATTALAPAAAAAEAEPRPPEAAEGEGAPPAAAEAEPAPPAAAEAKPRQSAAAAAAEESPRATKAAAWDAPCGIKTPANEAGPPGLGSDLQLHLNHAAVPKAVKKEDCLQEGLQAVQLPAAVVAATAAAAGSRATVGMKSRRVPTPAVPTGADTLPEHGVFTGAVDQVEPAGARGAKQHGIEKHAKPKVSLSKNSSEDAGGNGLGGDGGGDGGGGEGNDGVGLHIPSDTALEAALRAAGPNAVRNGSSWKGGMGAPRGERRLGLITAAVKAEPPAVGGRSASVPATAAAQGPSLPTAAGLAFPAAVIVPPLPVVQEGKSPMPAPAAVVVEGEAVTAGGSLFPNAAAGAVAQQVKYEKPAPQADDAAAMGSAAEAAPAPIAAAEAAPVPMNIPTTATGGLISAIGRTTAAEGFIGVIEGLAAATAAANGARMPAAIGVQSSAGTQTAATATTAAARRARSLHSIPMHAATAAEVIVIEDSDDESEELATGVVGVREGDAVFQQRAELREVAGVKQEPDTEFGNASTATTLAAAAAVTVCSMQAAILGEGVPAAAGIQMASNQQLLGALLPGLNLRLQAVGEGVLDIATPGAPVEVAAAAAAATGASSGDVTGDAAAAANPATGPGKSVREIPDTAAARSSGSIPLGVGLSGGEQVGHAIAAAARVAGASSIGVAAGTCEGNPNQVAAAGAEQDQLKDTSSVQDYDLKDTGNVVQAALEVMQVCEKLKVSLGWSNMVYTSWTLPAIRGSPPKAIGPRCGLDNAILQEVSNVVTTQACAYGDTRIYVGLLSVTNCMASGKAASHAVIAGPLNSGRTEITSCRLITCHCQRHGHTYAAGFLAGFGFQC